MAVPEVAEEGEITQTADSAWAVQQNWQIIGAVIGSHTDPHHWGTDSNWLCLLNLRPVPPSPLRHAERKFPLRFETMSVLWTGFQFHDARCSFFFSFVSASLPFYLSVSVFFSLFLSFFTVEKQSLISLSLHRWQIKFNQSLWRKCRRLIKVHPLKTEQMMKIERPLLRRQDFLTHCWALFCFVSPRRIRSRVIKTLPGTKR